VPRSINGRSPSSGVGDGSDLYALDNYDPIGKANVLSRGLVGDLRGTLVVASPLYKQHFSLASGRCLEQEEVAVATYPVRVNDGWVEVALTTAE
jgi:nitrite reductase (NADH) small subunit